MANEGFFPTPGSFPFLLQCVRSETETSNTFIKTLITFTLWIKLELYISAVSKH